MRGGGGRGAFSHQLRQQHLGQEGGEPLRTGSHWSGGWPERGAKEAREGGREEVSVLPAGVESLGKKGKGACPL